MRRVRFVHRSLCKPPIGSGMTRRVGLDRVRVDPVGVHHTQYQLDFPDFPVDPWLACGLLNPL